eukprot:CAMPEP_0116882752 /NCGR_PEP_ID=MMETSP0463-20121206/15109_1 /TAXON_ID=181622 /ORGANISM="Strombidinopsis sp, Strain SopsisLIS2011" /LENGTH=137 /DNA_ID=CAMNT_0004536501 /DNA_START=2186 /DNA_END=2599 /DNA_ORIENTATION=+
MYSFDVYNKEEPRWQWIHKEERKFHGAAEQSAVRSYTIPTVPVCTGDYLEFSVSLMSLAGVVNPETIEWTDLVKRALPVQDDIRNYNRVKNMTPDRNKFQKYFADLKRVCEVEDTVVEWFGQDFIEKVCQDSLTKHI